MLVLLNFGFNAYRVVVRMSVIAAQAVFNQLSAIQQRLLHVKPGANYLKPTSGHVDRRVIPGLQFHDGLLCISLVECLADAQASSGACLCGSSPFPSENS